MLLHIAVEIPAVYISSELIETKFFGRKNLISVSFLLTGIILLIIVLFHNYFTLLVILARFFIVSAFSAKYTLTSELYSTDFRSTAVGSASSFGKLGGIIMPWVCTSFFSFGNFIPYLSLAIICLVGVFLC